jgi:hypothetical protein
MIAIGLIALSATPQALAQAPSIAVTPVTNAEINRGAAEATTNAAAPMTQRKVDNAEKDKPAPEKESTPAVKTEPSAGK